MNRSWVWETGWVGGGLLAIALTFHSYRVESSQNPSGKHSRISVAEAERRATAARLELQKKPESISALTQLAIALYHKSPPYEEALNTLERARSLGAVDPTLFFYAGVMYDALGLPQYAANDLKKYLRHYPDDYEALVRLGNVYFHANKDEAAEGLYRDAVQRWKKDPTVWFNYGVVSVRRGRLEQAEECFAQVRRLAGDLPEGGIYQEGEIQRLRGNLAAAEALYQKELQRNPHSVPALQALDSLLRGQKRWNEAGEIRKRLNEVRQSSGTVTQGG